MDVDQEILNWLTNCPSGDGNFKSQLKAANEATIEAAIVALKGAVGKAVVLKDLKARLNQLQTIASETNSHHNGILAMDAATFRAERDDAHERQVQQADRERLIAQAHEVIGRVQSNLLMSKFTTVSNLVHLKQIKESKVYRDLPMVGTWDKYCDYIGLSRQKVDEDLANLAAFGEDFLLTSQQFGLGYREMRQLRQIKYDGESFSMSADGKTVVIEGETIALGDDAAPEIEAALEKLLERNKTLRERNTKLEKDFKGAVKEETLSFQSKEKALLERVKALEPYEPKYFDESAFEEQYRDIFDLTATLATKISGLIRLEDFHENPVLMARVEGFVESTSGLTEHLREEWSDALMFENK